MTRDIQSEFKIQIIGLKIQPHQQLCPAVDAAVSQTFPFPSAPEASSLSPALK